MLARLTVPPAASLIGQPGEALTELLGEPDLVRKEKGVEVLQYAGGPCVLLAYLYDTAEGRRIKYLDAVAKQPESGSFSTDGCLYEQAKANALKQPAS